MLSTGQHTFLLLLLIIPTAQLIELVDDKSTQCENIPKLDVLPGQGWNALTSDDMGRVIQLSYNDCKLTSDGKYVIPDNTEAVVIKTKELQVHGELIEHWSNYTTTTARGFKVGIGIWPVEYLSLYSSFSDDYKKIKSLQVKYRAVASRVQLRNSLYRIRAEPDAMLTSSLKEQFLEVMRAINRNHTEKAEYLLQVIVRDYGTHFSKSVDAGAVFVKEDFLRMTFIREHEKDKTKILSTSKVSFVELVGFHLRTNQDLDASFLDEYNAAVVDKRIRAIGGPNWKKGVTADEWLAGTDENMVAIDRSGDLLTSLITPSKFPNAPPKLLKKVYEMLGKAIQDYYKYNIREGCTQQNSPNFDYSANLEDGSCESVIHNHTFGGVFQTCTQPQHKDKLDVCEKYNRKNELTGDYSCPEGYTETQLYSHNTGYKFKYNYPWRECSGVWFWKKCWYNDDWRELQDQITLTTYSCMSLTTSSTKEVSYQFGGLYSPDVVNIHTKEHKCPTKFRTLDILYDGRLKLCVRNNQNSDNYYAMPFGGLTSCKTGLRCPGGYHGRLANVFEGCQINYCLLSAHVDDLPSAEPLLIQPPFINASEVFQEVENFDYDDYGIPQRIEQIDNTSASGSHFIGLIVSVCLMAVCVALGMIYWQRAHLFRHLQYFLNISRNAGPTPPPRAIVSLSQDKSKSSSRLVNSNSQVFQAWDSVNKELMTKNGLRSKNINDWPV